MGQTVEGGNDFQSVFLHRKMVGHGKSDRPRGYFVRVKFGQAGEGQQHGGRVGMAKVRVRVQGRGLGSGEGKSYSHISPVLHPPPQGCPGVPRGPGGPRGHANSPRWGVQRSKKNCKVEKIAGCPGAPPPMDSVSIEKQVFKWRSRGVEGSEKLVAGSQLATPLDPSRPGGCSSGGSGIPPPEGRAEGSTRAPKNMG